MSDFSHGAQAAIYALLATGSPTVAEGRVYDDVPDNPTYPFVQIAGSQMIPDDLDPGDNGVSEFFDLHVWSRERGFKQARNIMGAIKDILHKASLTIPGRASAHCWVRGDRLFREEDGTTRHGIVSIEIIHRS